jgi:hypothetical protein
METDPLSFEDWLIDPARWDDFGRFRTCIGTDLDDAAIAVLARVEEYYSRQLIGRHWQDRSHPLFILVQELVLDVPRWAEQGIARAGPCILGYPTGVLALAYGSVVEAHRGYGTVTPPPSAGRNRPDGTHGCTFLRLTCEVAGT